MDSVFLDILNDIGTNSNDKLFVLMHKTFNLPFKISFIFKKKKEKNNNCDAE